LFGLVGWTIERFIDRRRQLFKLQYEATRLREKSVLWCLLLVLAANALVFVSLAYDATHGNLSLGRLVVFAQGAVGASMIAFGGLNWALDGAAAPVAAVLRLESAMAPAGALRAGTRPADLARSSVACATVPRRIPSSISPRRRAALRGGRRPPAAGRGWPAPGPTWSG